MDCLGMIIAAYWSTSVDQLFRGQTNVVNILHHLLSGGPPQSSREEGKDFDQYILPTPRL